MPDDDTCNCGVIVRCWCGVVHWRSRNTHAGLPPKKWTRHYGWLHCILYNLGVIHGH